MRIAIASTSADVEGEISMQAARAPYFLIFEDGELKEVINNPFARGGGGAGWSVAKLLADKGIDKFIAGNIGKNMKEALEEREIVFEMKKGKVKEAL